MLTRESQIAIKLEATEGTEESLASADASGNRKNQSHRYPHEQYDREIDRATLTELAPLRSKFGASVSWVEELVGGSATVEAPWHRSLQAMGWKKDLNSVIKAAYTDLTGTFKPGDIIGNNATEGSATKKGRVVAFAPASTATNAVAMVWFEQTLGTWANADVATNYSRTGELTVGTPADGGSMFSPQTEKNGVSPKSATVERRLGTQRHTLVGGRGTGGLSFKHGQPVLLNCEFQGPRVWEFDNTTQSHKVREASAFANVPRVGGKPRVVQSIFLEFIEGTTSFTGVLTTFDINFGNTLARRSTATNVDLGNSGYLPTRITGRKITATIDPEHVMPAAGFDAYAKVESGAEFRVHCRVGFPYDANGAIVVIMPSVCLDGDFENSDRDGIVTDNLTVKAVGDDDDEMYVYHIF